MYLDRNAMLKVAGRDGAKDPMIFSILKLETSPIFFQNWSTRF
jgi:hypothetical protein